MCMATMNLTERAIGKDNYAMMDPLGARAETLVDNAAAPMLKTPEAPKLPPQSQGSRNPDAQITSTARNRNAGIRSGSLLTGPSGLVAPASTGRNSLLGG